MCEFHLLNKVNPSSGGFAVRQELDPAELPGSCGYVGVKLRVLLSGIFRTDMYRCLSRTLPYTASRLLRHFCL